MGMVDTRSGRCLRGCRVHSPGEIGARHQHVRDRFDNLAHVSSLTSVSQVHHMLLYIFSMFSSGFTFMA